MYVGIHLLRSLGFGGIKYISSIQWHNQESFNVTLKRLQHWREVPVDIIILSLYHLQAFYYNETMRGYSGEQIFFYYFIYFRTRIALDLYC